MEERYNINKFNSCLRGGVQFPTGGNAALADKPASES